MKKMNKILLCAVGATMLFSCVKENFEPQENPVPDGYEMQEFTATSYSDDLQSSTSKPSNAQTKTTVVINDDGTHGDTHWAKGDQLSIFWDGGKGTADLEGEGGSSIGKFKGAVESGKLASHAVYPSSVEASVDGNTVKVAIPAQQNGTFSAGNISVAEVAEDNKLSFNNINAFLCVQLVSGDITKITIESVGGQAIVGTIPVTFTDGNAECGEVENGASKVTMTKAVGETGRYYVSIVPGVTHTEGLLMTYYKGDEVTGSYQLDKQLAPVANKIYNFGEFEPDYNYYVTKDGAGKKTGVTWRDAMSFSDMIGMLEEAKTVNNTLNAINGAVFNLEEGEYAHTDYFELKYDSEDLVKLTFKGTKGKTSISGKNQFNVFDVIGEESALEVVFDGIGFVNGKGGFPVLYCKGSNLKVELVNCFLSDNVSTAGGNSNGKGAGIAGVDGAELIIENTVFERNEANYGGGVYSDGKVTLTRCTFIDNEAIGGGAVYGSNNEITVNGCTFENNSASQFGGAIQVGSNSKLTVTADEQTLFKNNTCKNNNSDGFGGAIIVLTNNTQIASGINRARFIGNSADYGGAISVYGEKGDKTTSKLYLTDCVFGGTGTDDGNYATSDGGAIYHEDQSDITLTRTELIGNYANGNGGAIAILGWEKFKAFQTDFIGNHAGNSGGVIYTLQSGASSSRFADLYIDECTFDANYSKTYGAVFNINQLDEFCMNNSSIRGSYSTQNYTSIKERAAWVAMDGMKSCASISNCTIIGNTQYSTDGTSFTKIKDTGLVYVCGNNYSFTNNIIVPESADVYSIVGDGSDAIDVAYTHYNKVGRVTEQNSGGNTSGHISSDLGSLTWTDGCWMWDGRINGVSPSLLPKYNAQQRLSSISPDFANWLGGDINTDQRNELRGTLWWPGAYEGDTSYTTSVKITTFNLRSSTMDENAASKTWSNRKAGVYEWFNTNQSAVVAAQECTDAQRRDILDNCSDYGAVYYERQSSWWDQLLGKDVDAPVVTFYKKSDVAVNSSGTFWLVEGAPTSPEESENQHQERCATWMKCTYKGVKMVVINAHLSYRTKAGEVEQSESMQTLRQQEMDVITGWIGTNITDADGPVVLLGDFNIDHNNAIFNYYKNGTNGFYYGRAEAKNTDMGRTFNNWYTECDDEHPDWKKQKTIDHQFFKGFRSIDSYLVDRNTYAGVELISDHWPLTAVYKF